MSTPVSLVTIHHEGDGDPIDRPRGADGGYSVWIGVTKFTMLRSPFESFGTLGFNHVSFDVCLSGNRVDHAVTDTDIVLIAAACAQARSNGWLVDHPLVRDHKSSPGSSTVCPGRHTMERFAEVTAACGLGAHPAPPLPPETVHAQFNPAVVVEPIVATLASPTRGFWQLAGSGAVYAWEGAPFCGRGLFAHGEARRLEPAPHGQVGYVIVDRTGGRHPCIRDQ